MLRTDHQRLFFTRGQLAKDLPARSARVCVCVRVCDVSVLFFTQGQLAKDLPARSARVCVCARVCDVSVLFLRGGNWRKTVLHGGLTSEKTCDSTDTVWEKVRSKQIPFSLAALVLTCPHGPPASACVRACATCLSSFLRGGYWRKTCPHGPPASACVRRSVRACAGAAHSRC